MMPFEWPTTMNGWGMLAMAIYLGLSMFAPQVLQQLKGILTGTARSETAVLPKDSDVRQENVVVKRRCMELKSSFPEASPEQRLSWAERGLDLEQAGQEYQDRLLKELQELRNRVKQEPS